MSKKTAKKADEKKFRHGWKFYAKFAMKRMDKYCMNPMPDKKELKKRKAFEKEYGFCYTDTYSLELYMALQMLPRFAYLRDHHHGFPSILLDYDKDGKPTKSKEEADEEWSEILDTIVRAFYMYLKNEGEVISPKKKALWKKAMEYFNEYYADFWD